ncbi:MULTISPECIES: DUF7260 family protein [Halolamina]|uniref:DUF7260 domain-containing protein n=1 Tax=Halolamina pelagica TaxID=699431 RepID=A0A1I5P2K7_9EURY|nr:MULTISPECIES: hypothetical protein [Halolamina]NHX36594.1 hypothetical protein [Halolamina sp. R1-12]SFP28207.1 hypothetical protein SAMN05216277_102313 [Halolamina pelagica]
MPASYSLAPRIEGEVAACSGAFGCLEALAGSLVGLVLWAGLATGLLFAPRANVRAALEALRVEYEAITAEQDALEAFVSRVEQLSPSGPKSTVEAGGVGVVGATTGRAGGMGEVRTAYRETVMDVPHYDRDYDESFPVNIANEFGDGVASAVLANDALSPRVKGAVIASAREGLASRNRYLDTLDRERERLDEAGTALEDAAARCDAVDGRRLRRRSFDDLQQRYERLETARDSLASTLDRRQEQIQDGIAFGWQRRDSESVYRYLYQDIDATYPVLADGTRVLERIDAVEHRLTTALTAQA